MKVYEYGCLKPDHEDLVMNEIRAGHRYYNKLIELELARRAKIADAQAGFDGVAKLRAELDTSIALLDTAKSEVRARRSDRRAKGDAAADKAHVDAAREHMRAASAALKAAKLAIKTDPRLLAAYGAIEADHKNAVKAARAQRGCAWGTGALAEAAADAARKTPTPPAFRRWDGTGAIGLQFTGASSEDQEILGLPCGEIVGGDDTRMQIDPLPTNPVSRRKSKHTVVRFRIGSNADRTPIFAAFPMVMHRPLPDLGVAKTAKVVMREVCGKRRWSLQITVDTSAEPRPARSSDRVAGIDLGWREMGDGIRVAYLHDGSSASELRLPSSIRSRLEKADAIRAQRDIDLDAIRPSVVAFVRGLDLDDAMRMKVASIDKWRSHERYTWLCFALHKIGIDVPGLDDWRRRNLHLWQYEHGMREHAIRHRRDIYRNFAAQISKGFGTVVLEDFDLRAMAKRSDGDTQEPREPQHQRHMAAVSTLRSLLITAVENAGGVVVKVPPKHTTMACFSCGAINEVGAKLIYACASCGESVDQDLNAARNIRASGLGAMQMPGALAGKKPRVAKWSKRHRANKEVRQANEADPLAGGIASQGKDSAV